jgi:hypothetical protein
VTILENLNVSIFWNGALNALREFYRTVVRIVVPHESADEADHDGGERRGRPGHHPAVSAGGDRGRYSYDQDGCAGSKSGKTGQSGSYILWMTRVPKGLLQNFTR